MSSAISSVSLKIVDADRLTLEKNCFWDGHRSSAAGCMHSLINSPFKKRFNSLAVLSAMI